MLSLIKEVYHQAHVAAVIVHVVLVFGEVYHIIPHI